MPAVNKTTKLLALPLLLAAMLLAGCTQSTSQQLIGRWQGRPDTFEANRKRNPIPGATGKQSLEEEQGQAKPVVMTEEQKKLERLQPSETTDLERFNFAVSLDFKRGGSVEMNLDGKQPIVGKWEVLSTDVGVSVVEIAVPDLDAQPPAPKSASDEGKQDDKPPMLRRRFSLKMNDDATGFTLREEGADPRFGWLYFQRAK